ncbi:MAG: hypothetical protein HC866_23645 [Leptolyngbyaceae cyanobacterium RU_5_1]|nr:hypothetical protein [Leptolyngbyaceae cyanobacterium RU_5_1]
MGLRLDAQLLKTGAYDPKIALLANHHYKCPAYLARVRLNPLPVEQRFVPEPEPSLSFTTEELSRGVERYWYSLSEGFENGIYEAQSVRQQDYLQTVWFRVQHQAILQVSTSLPYALCWTGFADVSIYMGCGHLETVRIYGNHIRIQRAIAQYQTVNCKECHRDALFIAGRITNQALGCSPLRGSQKQVRWAEQIRARILQTMLAYERCWDEFLAELEAQRFTEDDAACYLRMLKQDQAEASWWIDNRDLVDLWATFRFLRAEGM